MAHCRNKFEEKLKKVISNEKIFRIKKFQLRNHRK